MKHPVLVDIQVYYAWLETVFSPFTLSNSPTLSHLMFWLDEPIHSRLVIKLLHEIPLVSIKCNTSSLLGLWFSIKMSSYQYRKSHCGDKTVVRLSYLHNGISYTGKMSSLYWISTLEHFSLRSAVGERPLNLITHTLLTEKMSFWIHMYGRQICLAVLPSNQKPSLKITVKSNIRRTLVGN